MLGPALARLARCGALLSLSSLAACGTLSYGAVKTPHDPAANTLVKSSDDSGQSADDLTNDNEAYHPLTGRMDGVEYIINKNLASNSSPLRFSKQRKEKYEFPELKSAFESQAAGTWRPHRDFNIPVVKNAKVEQWIRTFNGPLRNNFARWMRRAGYYAPMIEDTLREYRLPSDILYLAMIESGFNTKAYSRARAAGIWQFIRSTGKLYGLEATPWVDERMDIVKATKAAAAHLRDLYRLYDDWYLAFAAYNAGAASVNRAIRRGGSRNYWALSEGRTRYFRQETKDYVPKILAAAIITKNYRKYGYTSGLFERPIEFDTVTVPDATDVGVIARCAGAPVEEIVFLNPSLIMGVTPPRQDYTVLVPAGAKENFRENYALVPREERARFAFHKVRGKETLAGISRQYGVSLKKLAQANHLTTKSRVKAGTNLVIPRTYSVSSEYLAKRNDDKPLAPTPVEESPKEEQFTASTTVMAPPTAPSTASVPATPSFKTYRVRKGDTLGKIASRHGVTVASLRELNRLSSRSFIRAGQTLKISQEETAPAIVAVAPPSQPIMDTRETLTEPQPVEARSYTVQKGDTLEVIASQNKISVYDLRKWNGLEGKTLIHPGQVLSLEPTRVKKQRVVAMVPKTTVKKQAASLATPNAASPKPVIIHFVKKGETLWQVSKKYGVTINQLKNWNSLNTNNLYPKQKLKIHAEPPSASAKRIALAP